MSAIIKYELKQILRTKLLWIGVGFLIIYLVLISTSRQTNVDLRDAYQYSYNSQATIILFIAIICGALAALGSAREIHNDNIGVVLTTQIRPYQYFFGKLFACCLITIVMQFILSFPLFLYWSIKEKTFFDAVSTKYFVYSFFLHELMLFLPFVLFIAILSYCLNMIFTKWRIGLIFPVVYIVLQFVLSKSTTYMPWVMPIASPYATFVFSHIEQLSPGGEYSRLIRVFSPIPFTSPSVILCIIIGLALTVIAVAFALISLNNRLGRGQFKKRGV